MKRISAILAVPEAGDGPGDGRAGSLLSRIEDKKGWCGMAIQVHEVDLAADSSSNVVRVAVSGKLTSEDYERFVPEMERLVQERGKVRILFEMDDFHGWQMGAMWEDFKFGVKHFHDIERIAMIGDKAWEHGMATFCRPFTRAKIRYFDKDQHDQARQWIEELA